MMMSNLLAPKERKIIDQMRNGHTADEIAESEGITPAAMRMRISRILKTLRDSIKPRYPR